MSQKFKFNILTGEDAPDKYAAIEPKEPFTFYLLQTGAGYLGTVKLFDTNDSAMMSGKFFRAVSSHIITQDDLDNENINTPTETKIGDVGMLFTADSDQEDNGNETFYFLPVQFKEIETIDEINPDDPGNKIPTANAVVNYVVQMLADKVSFEIDGIPGGDANGSAGGCKSTYSDTPIGTVISVMGVTAPKDYLICDGAEYNIADYPQLADYFATQFGNAGHFGGDGETTFAVPDLTNKFLRGYHGDNKEQLSGEIGETQEATRHFLTFANLKGAFYWHQDGDEHTHGPLNSDGIFREKALRYYVNGTTNMNEVVPTEYTSRPVNTAVLFCIRATVSTVSTISEVLHNLSLEEYDTEDGWHVRKWSNGHVEMDYTLVVNQYNDGWRKDNIGNGTIYVTRKEFRSPEYPVSLTKLLFKNVSTNAGWYAWSGDANNTDPETLTTDTIGCYILTTVEGMTTAPRNFIIMFHATGLWKEIDNDISIFNQVQQQNVYSLEEMPNGTWIDGKTIYRKVINDVHFPSQGNSTEIFTNYGLTALNIDNVIDVRAMFKAPDGSFTSVPRHNYTASSEGNVFNFFGISVAPDGLVASTYGSGANSQWFGKYITVVLEYTKTNS